jgi:PAS domain S-box-containing protein
MSTTVARPSARQRLKPLPLLLVALAYFAGGRLGLSFPTPYNDITLFWLPTGIAVAALWRWGMAFWPGVFLGCLLVESSLGTPILLSLGISVGNTLAPLLTAWLLKRWQFEQSFSRQRDLSTLISAASVGMLLSATVGTALLYSGNLLAANNAPLAWLNWWLGDSVGVLLAGPLLLSLTRSNLKELLRRPAELLLCCLLLSATAWLAFFADSDGHTLPLAFLPMPLVLWAALRRGVTGASLAVLVVSLLTTIGTAQGKGVFGNLPAETGMYMAWLYMFTMVLSGLMVITLLGERRKIEQSLLHANELLAVAQRKAKAGVWDWDIVSGKHTWSNELFVLFGLDPKITAASFDAWRNLIHPADLKASEDKVNEALRNGMPLFNEYRIVLPGGETKFINTIGKTTRNEDGIAIRMTGLCIDVTTQKQAEERLRFSEELLRQTQAVAAIGSWRLDIQSNELLWSEGTSHIFGITAEPPRSYEQFMTLVHPDDREKLASAWQAALRGEAPFLVQHRITVNGDIRWVEERAQLNSDADGNLSSASGSVQDITARVNTELKLLDSLHQLEEKELAKTRFLAAAGHDLRQPIAAANLFVDALKLASPTLLQSKLIDRLDQSMNTFAGLLERLLDISKFDAGLIKPQISSFNLAELFNWLEQNFAETAQNKQLHFRLYFPMKHTLIVRTDIGLLQSVLMNLVSNAIKFTAHGGILVSARLRGNTVLLQVWDTGIGIAEHDIAHIFDEFYQVANPERNREVGLGLGLAICRRAMSLLDGEVTCRSRSSGGSVFALTLPLNGAAHEVEAVPTSDSTTEIANAMFAHGKRVVILEDDPLVADGLLNLLQGLGAQVRHFRNAEEALRHSDIVNTDYYIVDYSLGGKLTGLEFLQTVQRQQPVPIRAVVVTGETSSQFIHRVADSPWPILHKPINYAKLAANLER